MPRLSGLETLRRVKQIKWRIPCILLSAALDDSIIRQAEMAEAFSVLSKPVSRGKITDVVALASSAPTTGCSTAARKSRPWAVPNSSFELE